MVGDKNTITNPSREKAKDLVASLTFSSSPIERIYLNPARIKDTTTTNTDKDIARFTTKNTNSDKFPKPVLLKVSKCINIRI